MNKKWLITIGVILGIVALGAAGYFAWQNRAKIAEVIPAIVGGGGITPIEKVESRLKVISSREVSEYWVAKTASSSDIFYVDSDKNIVKIDKEGIETSDVVPLKGVLEIIPAGSGKFLFAKLNKEGRSAVYDLANDKKAGDFIGMETGVWGAEDGVIAMIASSNDGGAITPQIVMGNMNDTKPLVSLLSSLSLQGAGLQWPQKDSIYITQKPSAEIVTDLWKFDIKTKTLKKILSDKGLIVQWAPFGDRALEFTTNTGREHKLSLIDGDGNRLKEFKFVTLPDKCIMTTASQVYCAIPRDQEVLTHMTLPDDYLKRSAYFKDGIYQIDIDKDSIRGIFEDENPDIDATDLTIMGDKLLFINRYDRKLYSLNLQ